MAVGNPALCHDLFGEEYTFWTDGLEVWFSSYFAGDENRELPLGRPATMAFEQLVEDSPIAVTIGRGGVLVGVEQVTREGILVTYLDEDGNRCSKISSLDGDDGSWEDVIGG